MAALIEVFKVVYAAKVSMLSLAILVALGGMFGFLKAKSKASLISGILSGALLGMAYSIAARNAQQGLVFGAVVCAVLCVVFSVRLRKTGKFMPSGLLLALCGLEVLFLAVASLTYAPGIP